MSNELATTHGTPATQSSTPASLIQLAIEKGADIEQLNKLMDLQERWEQKEAKKTFLDALAKFQATVPPIKKNRTATITKSTGGSFSYKFADLAGIAASIKASMQKCGLSYRWEFKEDKGLIKCTCILSHRDGHSETSEMEAGADTSGAKNSIQSKGSTQTYLQRYTLIGALGISTAEEDVDGKGAAPTKQQQPARQPAPAAFKKETMTDENEREILQLWKAEVNQRKTQQALTALYMQNRKTVDENDRIKHVFKERETEIKNNPNTTPKLP